MVHRLRSAFLRENSLMMVLELLRQSEMSEWEILEKLHARYGSAPTAREFRKLCDLILEGGYASLETVGDTQKLRMTRSGARLLRRLEAEYQAIVSGLATSRSPMLTR